MVNCGHRQNVGEWGPGCGELPTCKMWGKVRGVTPQFIHTNTPHTTVAARTANQHQRRGRGAVFVAIGRTLECVWSDRLVDAASSHNSVFYLQIGFLGLSMKNGDQFGSWVVTMLVINFSVPHVYTACGQSVADLAIVYGRYCCGRYGLWPIWSMPN